MKKEKKLKILLDRDSGVKTPPLMKNKSISISEYFIILNKLERKISHFRFSQSSEIKNTFR